MLSDATADSASWERRATLVAAGVYVIAWVIGLGIALSSFPASTASTAEWATFERDHQASLILQEYLIHGVAAVALIVFAAGLRTFLRNREGVRTMLSDVAYGGAIAAASVSLVQATFGQVLANKVSASGDLGAVRALLELDNQADTFKLLALALFVAAASLASLRFQALPRWLDWAGAIVALLLVLGGLSFPIGGSALSAALAASLLCLLAWVAAVAVVFFRRGELAVASGMGAAGSR